MVLVSKLHFQYPSDFDVLIGGSLFSKKLSLNKKVSATMSYVVEMLNIRKEFPGIVANDNITLTLKKGKYMPY